jgi:hypothetical protein
VPVERIVYVDKIVPEKETVYIDKVVYQDKIVEVQVVKEVPRIVFQDVIVHKEKLIEDTKKIIALESTMGSMLEEHDSLVKELQDKLKKQYILSGILCFIIGVLTYVLNH